MRWPPSKRTILVKRSASLRNALRSKDVSVVLCLVVDFRPRLLPWRTGPRTFLTRRSPPPIFDEENLVIFLTRRFSDPYVIVALDFILGLPLPIWSTPKPAAAGPRGGVGAGEAWTAPDWKWATKTPRRSASASRPKSW